MGAVDVSRLSIPTCQVQGGRFAISPKQREIQRRVICCAAASKSEMGDGARTS